VESSNLQRGHYGRPRPPIPEESILSPQPGTIRSSHDSHPILSEKCDSYPFQSDRIHKIYERSSPKQQNSILTAKPLPKKKSDLYANPARDWRGTLEEPRGRDQEPTPPELPSNLPPNSMETAG